MPRWLWSDYVLGKVTAPARGHYFRRKTVLRRARSGLQHTAGFRVARTRARHCARCLSRRGAARALATRARHAALVVVDSYFIQGHRTAAPARRLSPSAQDRGAPCQLRPPRHSRLSRGAHASASLRSLSIGRRLSTRACEACAPCRAGCGHVMHFERPLHRRKASLHRRKTVLRRASCGLQHTAGFRVARTRVRHCACCLSRRGTARALATRARHAALVVVNPYPI